MRIPRETESEGVVLNISSLLDVLFILIIFFMATTTFKQAERDIQVKLPESGAPPSLSSAPTVIVINVRGDVKEGEALYTVARRELTLSQLRDTVQAAVKANPDHKVLVRGDARAYHGQVANAVSVCREAGIQEVNIGYDFKPTR